MTDAPGTKSTKPTRPTRPRTKEVWLVEERSKGKAFWTRVGYAFENTDGSWNVNLSALPVGGSTLNIRDPAVKEAAAGPSAPSARSAPSAPVRAREGANEHEDSSKQSEVLAAVPS